MVKQAQSGITASANLLTKIHDLHPKLSFCGEPKNAILEIPDDLLNYVLSLLKNDPTRPPQEPLSQWQKLLKTLKSHWIIPLLYWQAGRLPNEYQPPTPIMDLMRDDFQWSRVRDLNMERQLREITTAFANFGEESLDHINKEFILNLFNKPDKSVPKLIDAIHFNNDNNKNLYLSNKNNKIFIFNNGKWNIENKDKTVVTILPDTGERYLSTALWQE